MRIIDPTKEPAWDRFVATNRGGLVCHLSSWKKLLENSFKHIKGHFLVITDTASSDLQAGLPLYEVRSWLTGHRLVGAPFAALYDPLVSEEGQIRPLLDEAIQLSRELGCSYLEIRTLRAGAGYLHDTCGVCLDFKHHFIELDTTLNEIWKKFQRQSVRSKIMRAEKRGVSAHFSDNEIDLRNFYQLYIRTRKKLSLPAQPYRFFHNIWHYLRPEGYISLLTARKGNLPIAGLIIFHFKNRVSAECLAYDDRYLTDFCPNHLLFWEAIKMAFTRGYEIFDFGRTSVLNTGLMVFKAKWGTKIVDIPIYYYPPEILLKKRFDERGLRFRTLKGVCRIMPVSLSTIFGDLVYRHIG